MNTHVENLLEYIRSLKDLIMVDGECGYQHIGAAITDAVLQAGVNYNHVVKPRVEELLKNYPEAANLSEFKQLIDRDGIGTILSWKDDSRKAHTIRDMVLLFVSEKIETVEQLKDWMTFHENREKLKAINGVGDKTIKYLAVLAGLDDAPIDTHVRKFLKNAGIKVNDAEASEIMKKTAEALNIPLPLFDNSIWKYMSERNNKKEKALEYLT